MQQPNLATENFDLFIDGGVYINCMRMYYAYFKIIPTIKSINNLNLYKVRNWIEDVYKDETVSKHARQRYDWQSKRVVYSDAFFLLNNNLLINLEGNCARILHNPKQEDIATELLCKLKRFVKRERQTQEISLVINTQVGLDTTELKIRKPKLQLTDNYNDDLLPLHTNIVASLKQKNKSGLYLFHGVPGTGKSTYIRYLIRSINKKVIFLPPGLAGNLDAPDFTRLLINNENTVFVIEDAEDLLSSREAGRNSSISMLLNLTDGLLGESLGIQIIATFNTDLMNIDKALLRKGRLMALYDFKPLTVEKTNRLLEKLGTSHYPVQQPLTLAEIYNIKEESFQITKTVRPQIGFMSKAV